MFSIIIPTYNNLALTKKCLDSIFANSKKDLLKEVIVIDDNSSDGSQGFLAKDKRIKSILNKKNQGFAKNNNKGAAVAQGDILVFLNNDTEVHPGWLEAIAEAFKEKNVGAVGVKLLFPDGTIQHAGVVISVDKVPRHIYYKSNSNAPYVNKLRDFQVVTAACVAIPKKVYQDVGGFDEKYINGMEDVDLCLRIKESGLRVVYQPKAVVTHHESVAPGRHLKNIHNANLYMERWGDKVVPDQHRYYREDGFSFIYPYIMDLKNMAYASNDYGKKPLYVSVLKWIYIPLQKIYLIIKLIITGDFETLNKKAKKVLK